MGFGKNVGYSSIGAVTTSRQPLLAVLLIALLALPGCDDEKTAPAKIAAAGHSVMAGSLDREINGGLRFLVTGKKAVNFLGAASTPVAPDAEVTFRIASQPEGAEARLGAESVRTDAGGVAAVSFFVGDKPGAYRVEASVAGHPDIPPAIVTIMGGVVVSGGGQDGLVGSALDHNLEIRLESAPGKYLGEGQGRVRFDLRSDPGGTVLASPDATTDENGIAGTAIRLGKRQGQVEVGVMVAEGPESLTRRLTPLVVTFFAMDLWRMSLSLIGGLALFIFGMRMMSDGLQFVAGDRMRSLLNILTANRFAAVGAGAMVTALIQSSSACTVMVVGFVNAGLMQLRQAIGVVMGANIGTTVTAQIIALKLSELALPAVAVGVLVSLVAKKQSVKHWGGVVIGFGILFLGMNIMSQEMGDLSKSSTVISMFQSLSCTPPPGGYVPLGQFLKAIACGLAATLILQSSAATIGMLIAVASAGLLDPFASFGILLGDNIGTTITAVLASIGSGTTAKRAACFHVLFNVFGACLMLALNYVTWPGMPGHPAFLELANRFTPGDVFAGENLPRFIANAHTMFNVSCTILFIPFVSQFTRLCEFLIKPKGAADRADETRRILEPRLLATPSIALQQVWAEVGVMLEKGRESQTEGYRALISTSTPDWDSMAEAAKTLEQETDTIQAAVTDYLGGISLTALNENQSAMFPRVVRTVNDAERIGDIGRHLSKLAKRVKKRSLPFTEEAIADMDSMMATVNEIIQLAEKCVNLNADGIETSGGGAVLRQKFLDDGKNLEKAAKAKATELRKNHERRHEAGLCDIRTGVIFLDVANSLARSAGNAMNIIEAACYTTARSK